jgi:serine/threonine-protein kinase
LKDEPQPISSIVEDSPRELEKIVARCLRKDPARRFQHMDDVKIALEELKEESDSGKLAAPVVQTLIRAPWKRAMLWVLALLAVCATGILAVMLLWPRVGPPAVVRFSVAVPAPLSVGDLALSDDGSQLAYTALGPSGAHQLYLRSLNQPEAVSIGDSETPWAPFFSPDSRWLGFWESPGALKKVSLAGGTTRLIASRTGFSGASWGADGGIVFTARESSASGLFVVPSAGGTPRSLTVPNARKDEGDYRWAQILPGGKAVVFTVVSRANPSHKRTDVLGLDTGERHTLVEDGGYAQYLSTGHLAYLRAQTLMAVPFDLRELRVTGSPVAMLDGIRAAWPASESDKSFAVSPSGSLAYLAGRVGRDERELLWVDRKGATRLLLTERRPYDDPSLSPDGSRLAVTIEGEMQNLWVYDITRGSLIRVTFEAGYDMAPVWSPDSRHLAFCAARGGRVALLRKPSDGTGSEEVLFSGGVASFPTSWSRDGKFLAFIQWAPDTDWDVWVLPLEGERKPIALLRTPFRELSPVFSPDSRWLAYVSNETGRNEVYVRPFPDAAGRWKISTEGGTQPRWAGNGRELFYRNGNKMLAVSIDTRNGFGASQPKLLFEGAYRMNVNWVAAYDVTADGQRFVMSRSRQDTGGGDQIHVVLNWSEEVKRKVK